MPPENNSSSITPITPLKIGKFMASRIIVRESWGVLKQDKEIMWFPVVSAICTLLTVSILAVLYFFVVLGGSFSTLNIKDGKEIIENSKPISDIASYGILFIYYIVIFFIANFFKAGLLIIVQGRFSGQNLSFSNGIHGASKYTGKIFRWSIIEATVGLILQIISDKSKLVGKIVSGLLGAGWSILTFFSLPSLVIGNFGVKDSFKDSASIIRKTWGETIIVNFGVGLFISLFVLMLYAIFIAIAVIFKSLYVSLVLVALFLISLIVISIISSTLNSIFKLVLYNYARTGQIPQGFSPDIVKGAVKAKS